jgi:hypothetical protein
LKPSEAGDGASIVSGVPLHDTERLQHAARDAYCHGDDYLLEAQVDYLTVEMAGRQFIMAPSGHVRFGQVADGLTLQFLHGPSWGGNAYFDAATCHLLGLSESLYEKMRAAMHDIADAFHGSLAENEDCLDGLVTGGIDFAVGRIGGRWGSEILAAATDFNLSSHGAEYLRAFLDGFAGQDPTVYGATRVYRPALSATLHVTKERIAAAAPAGESVEAIACVPGSWGMVACTGDTPLTAADNVFRLVDMLGDAGLAE